MKKLDVNAETSQDEAKLQANKTQALAIIQRRMAAKKAEEQKVSALEAEQQKIAQEAEKVARLANAAVFREGITLELINTGEGRGVNSDFISRLITFYFLYSDRWNDPDFETIKSILSAKKHIVSVTEKEFIKVIKATNKPPVKPPVLPTSPTLKESFKSRIEELKQNLSQPAVPAKQLSPQERLDLARPPVLSVPSLAIPALVQPPVVKKPVQKRKSADSTETLPKFISRLRLKNEDKMDEDELKLHVADLMKAVKQLEQTYGKKPSNPVPKRKHTDADNQPHTKKGIDRITGLKWTISSLYKQIQRYDENFIAVKKIPKKSPVLAVSRPLIKKEFFGEDEKNSEWQKIFAVQSKTDGTNCATLKNLKAKLDTIKVHNFSNSLFDRIISLATAAYSKAFISAEARESAVKLVEKARQELKQCNSQLALGMFIPISVTLPKSLDMLCAFADYAASIEKDHEKNLNISKGYFR